jgi:hypothetical protein
MLADLDEEIDRVHEAEDEGIGDWIVNDVCATLKMIRDVHPDIPTTISLFTSCPSRKDAAWAVPQLQHSAMFQ